MRRVQADDRTMLPVMPGLAWQVLTDFAAYSQWWPRSVKIVVRWAEPGLVGTQFQVRPLGGRGFVCAIESAIPEQELRLRYIEGLYRGTGVWKLTPRERGTEVSYCIDLEIADRFVTLLSYVLNVAGLHSRLMRQVYAGLARHLTSEAGRERPDS